MNLSPRGKTLIQRFEELKLQAYEDQRGVWTIGWGHTRFVFPYQTCTLQNADDWFFSDVADTEIAINKNVTVPLNQNMFDALVSFTFNVGIGAEQHSTLLQLLNEGNYSGAAAQFPRWNHINGVANVGLTRRRKAEQDLFMEPV
jgi:lysozyme